MDVLALHEAIQRLQSQDGELARLVELRFFAGLTEIEAADAMHASPATVRRMWRVARAWLAAQLGDDEPACTLPAGD
jgi:DNA-directed RNA polymerase specialized sigma24 family protein